MRLPILMAIKAIKVKGLIFPMKVGKSADFHPEKERLFVTNHHPRSQSSSAIIECDVTRQADRKFNPGRVVFSRSVPGLWLVGQFVRIAHVGLGTRLANHVLQITNFPECRNRSKFNGGKQAILKKRYFGSYQLSALMRYNFHDTR